MSSTSESVGSSELKNIVTLNGATLQRIMRDVIKAKDHGYQPWPDIPDELTGKITPSEKGRSRGGSGSEWKFPTPLIQGLIDRHILPLKAPDKRTDAALRKLGLERPSYPESFLRSEDIKNIIERPDNFLDKLDGIRQGYQISGNGNWHLLGNTKKEILLETPGSKLVGTSDHYRIFKGTMQELLDKGIFRIRSPKDPEQAEIIEKKLNELGLKRPPSQYE